MPSPPAIDLLTTPGFAGYALIDSGNGRKLERYGSIVLDRPEPQAMWAPRRPLETWQGAHAAFRSSDEDGDAGRWQIATPVPPTWPVLVEGVTLACRLTSFRHVGLFPEQLPHWQWMLERLAAVTGERPRVLNLFAYTGAATLIAARAGAEVTHVDASKRAIIWAKENQRASALDEAPIRWILDDARKFAAREVRRARSYHVVLVDPPKFGRGPDGEVWDFFADLPALIRDCAALLTPHRGTLVLTSYAIRASTLATGNLVREVLGDRPGICQSGELAIREDGGGRLLPTSHFTRWAAP